MILNMNYMLNIIIARKILASSLLFVKVMYFVVFKHFIRILKTNCWN